MKIALLGYGKEGQALEKYFKSKAEIEIFENFDPAEIRKKDFSAYNMVFRSPSVPPLETQNETSMTRYFFDHCPCPIIGVTATKGKGTTCSFIKALLDASGADACLVGNIGDPAIDYLDKLTADSVVVFEMSSFQLWDLKKSPHIAVVGTIEPDHLNIHKDYEDYIDAKTNICRYQSQDDYLVYYHDNPESVRIAEKSGAKKISYPFDVPDEIKKAVKIPGMHNLQNAMAAIAAVACYKGVTVDDYLNNSMSEILQGLANFKGLPHRLEYLYELNGVKYYDDNFATNPSSTRVAVESFPDDNLIMIVGGRDKTENADLPELYEILSAPNIKKIVLIGESGHELANRYQDERFIIAESLEEAINTARTEAEKMERAVVVMSPAAASFDMFENVYDRGGQFRNLILSLN